MVLELLALEKKLECDRGTVTAGQFCLTFKISLKPYLMALCLPFLALKWFLDAF